jgi:translation elongation factor P/translation initiation factor 5A
MVTAQQLRTGMAVRYEGQSYRVMACEYHPGQGKMGGVAHVRLKNLGTGTFWETSFRADLKLEEIRVDRPLLSFLYAEGDQSWFMDPQTYEQTAIPNAVLEPQARFLDEIDYDDMLLLARLGAGVVHPRSVEAGKRFHIPVWVRSTFTTEVGTKICSVEKKSEEFVGIALKHIGEQDAVSMVYRNASAILGGVRALLPGFKVSLEGDAVTVTLSKAEAANVAKRLYERFAVS